MGQGTLTFEEAVDALEQDVSTEEARRDVMDGLLVTGGHPDVVWIGDWFRWMRYRSALVQFAPEKRQEFREAMIEAMRRREGKA